jgi:hypothetical protein
MRRRLGQSRAAGRQYCDQGDDRNLWHGSAVSLCGSWYMTAIRGPGEDPDRCCLENVLARDGVPTGE